MQDSPIRQAIQQALPELVAIRHDLHQHPELSYQERRTCEVVQRELAALGIEFKGGLASGTGVVAHPPATVEPDRLAVGRRADMDALPITQQTGKSYASVCEGVMHACGHDGHTAILLGAARILSQLDERPNPVTFLFQPAEEGGAGAEKMCDDGALLGEKGGGVGAQVGSVFGLHGWPQVPLGIVSSKPGPVLAATDDFEIVVKGRQCHAAYPHVGADPIVGACQIVSALQTIVSRNIGPADSVVVTVGTIHAGTANNVIPHEARMTGTVRTLTPESRRYAKERLFAIVENTAQAMGCHATINWEDGYPVTSNDAELTERFFAVARDAVGPEQVRRLDHSSLGGEDFAYYGHHVPTCFYLLGLKPDGVEHVPQLHQPDFDFNDDAIPLGVEMMCRLALSEQ